MIIKYGGSTCVVALGALLATLALTTSSSLAAGDASAASCANEASPGFRSYLPDCRAYEMVSPPYEEGGEPTPFAVSSDGSGLLIKSSGVFDAAESDALGAGYLDRRESDAWSTISLDPSISVLTALNPRLPLAASTDLSRTLFAARTSAQSIYAEDLYIREANGSLIHLGPMAPPISEQGPPGEASQALLNAYEYAGADSNLTRVLFYVRNTPPAVLWPGDFTLENIQSLYEYTGNGAARPALVGVSDGSTVENGEILPAGTLISDCATYIGSSGGADTYNVVSAHGEKVFFTAAGGCGHEIRAPKVNELYARIRSTATVPISEPTPVQCGSCNTETAVRRNAEFAGASEDGSKVYFTTEQELLPGATTQNLYEYDFDDKLGQNLLGVTTGSADADVQGVARVSEDGSHVYFVAKGVLTQGANGEGREPVQGADNLYDFDHDRADAGGHVIFVATLSEGDETDWAGSDHRQVQTTPDGRYLVFASTADLTPGDTSSQRQIFEYDAESERLVRVSVGRDGYGPGGTSAEEHGSKISEQSFSAEFQPTSTATGLAVSANGSAVVFASSAALTPEALLAGSEGATSVYEYRSSGSIGNGDVYLISDGKNAPLRGGTLAVIDASGENIYFETPDPLLSQDGNTQLDIYDARVGGGFPTPAEAVQCAGEACSGPAAPPVAMAAPRSLFVSPTPGGGGPSRLPSIVAPRKSSSRETRAQKRVKALKACHAYRSKRRRAVCEAQARRRYGPEPRSKTRKGGNR